MAEDKHYFYFVSKFAQKNNSIFIVHVLLKSKHYVILFSFSKWPKKGQHLMRFSLRKQNIFLAQC